MRIGVATVHTPGIRGGAEFLADGLVSALQEAGHPIHRITMPFHFAPPEAAEHALAAWQAQDFSRFDGGRIDRMICLKFPAYALSHPDKRVWLLHQHRPAYDLYGTPHGFAAGDPASERLRAAIRAADQTHLRAARSVHTIARRVSRRLLDDSGIASTPLYHPPADAGRFAAREALPYLLVPSRIEALKRQDLVIRALALTQKPITALIAGDGGQRSAVEALARSLGLDDTRVRFLGPVSRAELIALYGRALAVFFGPRDEDYGYVTLEAMLSGKPVITCSDSGGPLEFVVNGETGVVSDPQPDEIADHLDRLFSDPAHARRLGEAGRARYDSLDISWSNVVEALAGPDPAGKTGPDKMMLHKTRLDKTGPDKTGPDKTGTH